MDEKVFYSQKYFIFKLPDMLNNSYHVFEEKRMESLQFSLQLCLDTYEEINNTVIGTDKLEKAYRGLLESLSFELKRHPFKKLDVYKRDFDRVNKLIGDSPKQKNLKYELYMCLKTLQKKLKQGKVSDQYIECLKSNMSYGEIDILLEAFVSDLLYAGYSLVYLSEWYTENIRENGLYQAVANKNLEDYLLRFSVLDGTSKEFEVIIPYKINGISQAEMAKEILQKHFEVKNKEDFVEYGDDWKWTEETYACKKYNVADYYKAIDMAKKEFSTDKELFSMCQNVASVIRENVEIGCLVKGDLLKVDIRKVDYTRLINYFDEARARQFSTFIELKDLMKSSDVDILERILHTLHNAKSYNIQNRYLNFWSALEYAIYPFPKESIIEKARVLVSESFTLFYIKDKMNIFWKRLGYVMRKRSTLEEYSKCNNFIKYCKEEDGFNTLKLIGFLQNKSLYDGVLEELSFHIVLEREMRELIMLVTVPKKARKILVDYHDSIVHDLDCVYRMRNQLIHSAKGMDDSLEHISLRLYRYVNSIVATILYYKKRNSSASIVEILNSLHNTYEVYMDYLQSIENKELSSDGEDDVQNGYKIVRPPYLFLD